MTTALSVLTTTAPGWAPPLARCVGGHAAGALGSVLWLCGSVVASLQGVAQHVCSAALSTMAASLANTVLTLLFVLCFLPAAQLPHLPAVHIRHQCVHRLDLWCLPGKPVCEACRVGGSSGSAPGAGQRGPVQQPLAADTKCVCGWRRVHRRFGVPCMASLPSLLNRLRSRLALGVACSRDGWLAGDILHGCCRCAVAPASYPCCAVGRVIVPLQVRVGRPSR